MFCPSRTIRLEWREVVRTKHAPWNSDWCQPKDHNFLSNFQSFQVEPHTIMTEKGGQQVSFSFQIGLIKDKITVDSTDLTLKYLKTLALSFVNEKFPENGISRLVERLMVFKHDYTAENVLQVELSPNI